VFVPEYEYTLVEYDPERPWLVASTQTLTVALQDAQAFPAWASRQWPAPRYKAELRHRELRPWRS
jgi:hypothetical protein